ncbi:hypothetical protein CR513_37750, partial [Mucuna pruriens]
HPIFRKRQINSIRWFYFDRQLSSAIYLIDIQNQFFKAKIKLLVSKKHSEKDKASILAETVKQVKEPKKKVSRMGKDGFGNLKDVKFPNGIEKLNL